MTSPSISTRPRFSSRVSRRLMRIRCATRCPSLQNTATPLPSLQKQLYRPHEYHIEHPSLAHLSPLLSRASFVVGGYILALVFPSALMLLSSTL
jgi:hypothetical protein